MDGKAGHGVDFHQPKAGRQKSDARAGRYGTFAGSVDTLAVFLKPAK